MSDVERIKQESRGLRGTLAEELGNDASHFSESVQTLLKFHGSYQQEQRDERRERKKAGLEPAITLGTALGPAEAPFDPGRQGSYFQTAAEVATALADLQALLQAQPALATELAPLQGMLQQAARHRLGLYVTF